jgi:hypothetical protein
MAAAIGCAFLACTAQSSTAHGPPLPAARLSARSARLGAAGARRSLSFLYPSRMHRIVLRERVFDLLDPPYRYRDSYKK